MRSRFCLSAAALALAASVVLQPAGARPVRAALQAVNCAATTLTLQPGLNPPTSRIPVSTAPDIPRGHYTVSLPVYPGATPLKPYIGYPFPEFPEDPYLQTASAEYQSADDAGKVQSWVQAAFGSCGWHGRGYWNGNTTPFSHGDTLAANADPDLTVEVSYGDSPSGGAYVAYGVEEITLPPRPASSYLHGQFAELRIALRTGAIARGASSPAWHVVHVRVRRRAAIQRLVAAINRIKGYRTTPGLCLGGGLSLLGPAWLSFVRPDGSVEHAFAAEGCNEGLAVNGVRWLEDRGEVWGQIVKLAHAHAR